jgi:hypothetical protein
MGIWDSLIAETNSENSSGVSDADFLRSLTVAKKTFSQVRRRLTSDMLKAHGARSVPWLLKPAQTHGT